MSKGPRCRTANRLAVSATVLWILYALTAGRAVATGTNSLAELLGEIPLLGWILTLTYALFVPFATRRGGFTLIREGEDIRPSGWVARALSLVIILATQLAVVLLTGVLLGERTWNDRLSSFADFLSSPLFIIPAAATLVYCLFSPLVWPSTYAFRTDRGKSKRTRSHR
ncbi:hypothetical protein GCM10018966_093880 [Streptomyces yanii]